jgi:hypothetical protein
MVVLCEAIDLTLSRKKRCPRFGARYRALYIRSIDLQTLFRAEVL